MAACTTLLLEVPTGPLPVSKQHLNYFQEQGLLLPISLTPSPSLSFSSILLAVSHAVQQASATGTFASALPCRVPMEDCLTAVQGSPGRMPHQKDFLFILTHTPHSFLFSAFLLSVSCCFITFLCRASQYRALIPWKGLNKPFLNGCMSK